MSRFVGARRGRTGPGIGPCGWLARKHLECTGKRNGLGVNISLAVAVERTLKIPDRYLNA